MGNNYSGASSLRFNSGSRNGNKNWFRVDPLVLSKEDVEEILEDSAQKVGTYIVYQDKEREKTSLAVKMSNGHVAHHNINKLNDLYYFNDFPFPYLESIILYYQRHKFRGTKFTQQAFVSPYVTAQRSKKNATMMASRQRAEPKAQKNHLVQGECAGTWSYGQYKPFKGQLKVMTQRNEKEEDVIFQEDVELARKEKGITTPM